MQNMFIGIVFLAVYILELLVYTRATAGRHEAKVRAAQAAGHVIRASLSGNTKYRQNQGRAAEYYARYEYEVNGRQYHKVERFTSTPPDTITLFYIDDPKKTFSKEIPADIAQLPLLIIAVLIAATVKIFILQ